MLGVVLTDRDVVAVGAADNDVPALHDTETLAEADLRTLADAIDVDDTVKDGEPDSVSEPVPDESGNVLDGDALAQTVAAAVELKELVEHSVGVAVAIGVSDDAGDADDANELDVVCVIDADLVKLLDAEELKYTEDEIVCETDAVKLGDRELDPVEEPQPLMDIEGDGDAVNLSDTVAEATDDAEPTTVSVAATVDVDDGESNGDPDGVSSPDALVEKDTDNEFRFD